VVSWQKKAGLASFAGNFGTSNCVAMQEERGISFMQAVSRAGNPLSNVALPNVMFF